MDWTPPRARLSVDPAEGVAVVEAWDAVFDTDLEYSFQVDGGAYSAWSTERTYRLPAEFERVTAQVRDGAGNTREVTWRGPQFIHGRTQRAQAGCGCQVGQGAGGWAAGLLALGLLALRRRRRA